MKSMPGRKYHAKEKPMTDKKNTLLPDPPPDSVTIRCPRLGHQINYSYCQGENSGLPCFKTLDCWYPYFDVQTCLENQLAPADFKILFQKKVPPKILSLLDLIEQAKQRQEGVD
jgi:hypothetical protein